MSLLLGDHQAEKLILEMFFIYIQDFFERAGKLLDSGDNDGVIPGDH